MKAKLLLIWIDSHNPLGIVSYGADAPRAVRAVCVSINVPDAVVRVARVPSRDVLRWELGEVDVAEVVARVDNADCDGRRRGVNRL